ncbi:hypothetical protein U9M48_039958 [Paspalum notatum var. saurae]|uniref:Uncharacterized protein n=1 Tax=Paspalum notatum var. saurae TaxID=547442 RepID=A0AAQ3URA8_PASNO
MTRSKGSESPQRGTHHQTASAPSARPTPPAERRRPLPHARPKKEKKRGRRRYVVKNQVRGATSIKSGPKDQLSPKHDLECPSVVFGRRSCPRDQGVAWGKASQPGKLTLA